MRVIGPARMGSNIKREQVILLSDMEILARQEGDVPIRLCSYCNRHVEIGSC